MDFDEGLTEGSIGEEKPKKNNFYGGLAVFSFAVIVSIFVFVPGARDVLREAESIVSKSFSDTFSFHGFGKLVVEVPLDPNRAPAADIFSASGTVDADSSAVDTGRGNTPPEIQGSQPKKSATSVTKVSTAENASAKNVSLVPVKIIIGEIQIAGASTTNDFIKISNLENNSVDIGGWKLKKKTNSGTEYSIRVFPVGSSIAPRGNFVWANSSGGFNIFLHADAASTQTIAADNGIALFDSNDTLVDAVAWGSGNVVPYIEGVAYPTNPSARKILSRKVLGDSMQDTNNNSTDFEIK